MAWRYIEDDGVTADRGLAGDEFLMGYYAVNVPVREPTLRLYTYRSHCALVGRFQNIEAELDVPACLECDVQFTRRPTGGGAILMGQDQLGICFTSSSSYWGMDMKPAEIYQRFSLPLIRALEKLGIQTRFRPKNDLEVRGRKIAGLGVYFDPFGALLFHASLLVGLNIPLMLCVLKIPTEKISDKSGVSSVAQRITTVSAELNRKVAIDEVRKAIGEAFEEVFQTRLGHDLWNVTEEEKITRLAREKYLSSDWIFQRSPNPDITGMSVRKTPAGLLRIHLGLKGDIIKNALITGDFLDASETLNRIEARLKWTPLEKQSISRIVRETISQNGALQDGITPEDITESVWKAGLNARAKNRITNRGSCYYPLSQTPAES